MNILVKKLFVLSLISYSSIDSFQGPEDADALKLLLVKIKSTKELVATGYDIDQLTVHECIALGPTENYIEGEKIPSSQICLAFSTEPENFYEIRLIDPTKKGLELGRIKYHLLQKIKSPCVTVAKHHVYHQVRDQQIESWLIQMLEEKAKQQLQTPFTIKASCPASCTEFIHQTKVLSKERKEQLTKKYNDQSNSQLIEIYKKLGFKYESCQDNNLHFTKLVKENV